ncbi:IS110 family transposase [Bosea psychrotolerans]|uniref:Transposase n=1 Tax=Bosea psychrotolerans TaxID=1871628 RepID=A0A2S4LRT4_9HYPH|nr:IS110 family transposase [Bosea psychrotolerans]POR45059.1 transposase [Bosea psychrotolerans]
MDHVIRIGLDTSKRLFQVHGVDASEQAVLKRKLGRSAMEAFFAGLAPTLVALEACGASHHWARVLTSMGHDVRLIAPQLAKPYVKRGKNDAADAEALCEAAGRPSMRFVPTKSAQQQADLMLAGMRERLGRRRTQLANTIRGYAAEFGYVEARGAAHVRPLLETVRDDPEIPPLAREMFAELALELTELEERLCAIEARLKAWHLASETSRRLAEVPGIGPIIATTLVMKTPHPEAFRSGRDFAAWIGLTPKDHSTAGKTRLGRITRAGDETLRSLLVVGATAVVWQVRRGKARRPMPWLTSLLARKPPKLAAIALANKLARIAWVLLARGGRYRMSDARPEACPAAA